MAGIASATKATSAIVALLFTSDLLAGLLAEQAARPGDEKADHDDEGIGVAEVRRDIAGAEGLDQAEEHAADDGAGQVAEAADHAHHESFQAQAAAHGRFGQEDRRHPKPRYSGQHGAEPKRNRHGAIYGNAHQAPGLQVLRRP